MTFLGSMTDDVTITTDIRNRPVTKTEYQIISINCKGFVCEANSITARNQRPRAKAEERLILFLLILQARRYLMIAKHIVDGMKRKKNHAIGEKPIIPAPIGVVVKTGSGLKKNQRETAGTTRPPHVSRE
jgi:hypothetical protein